MHLLILKSPEHPSVVWTGYGKRTPVLIFRADALVNKTAEVRTIGGKRIITLFTPGLPGGFRFLGGEPGNIFRGSS